MNTNATEGLLRKNYQHDKGTITYDVKVNVAVFDLPSHLVAEAESLLAERDECIVKVNDEYGIAYFIKAQLEAIARDKQRKKKEKQKRKRKEKQTKRMKRRSR